MRPASRAFTLIELLVVVAVIAILAAIAVPNFLEAQVRAKVSRVKNDMRTLDTALSTYRVDFNGYPPDYGMDEFRSWVHLTTPVAYVSTVLLDVFDTTNASHAGAGRFHAFAYLNPEVNATWWEQATGAGLFWAAVSPGPNNYLDWQDAQPTYHWLHVRFPELSNSPAMLYDPTNGTVSTGDLVRSNLGIAGG